ncbi:MAG: S49 family peptidase [Methanobrevibacter sp.]|nr:S49 family peptidase [Methanobrevibacter sp.]
MDKNGFMNLIKDLDKSKGLDLILHTPGGSISATESIIDYLHSIFGENIRAIIPQIAMSGGTMIACSCKEILMGKHSSLGPADPQSYGIPAITVIEEFELAKKEIEENPKSIPFWKILLDKYPANFLFECKNSIEWAKDILEKSLKYSMFKNKNQTQIDKIIYELILGDATKSHARNLSPKKCREIGLNIRYIESDEELQDLVLSIHHACLSYFNKENVSKIYLNQNGTFLTYNLE